MTHRFTAVLDIIGINPFVSVPEPILASLFKTAGRASGPIPVKGLVNGKDYRQTLVRYKGAWRLYINLSMLPDSPRRTGESLELTLAFDPGDRSIPMHPALEAALKQDDDAGNAFGSLPPSRQKEIVRYITALKSEEAVVRNVSRAIDFLHGKGRFLGRDGMPS